MLRKEKRSKHKTHVPTLLHNYNILSSFLHVLIAKATVMETAASLRNTVNRFVVRKASGSSNIPLQMYTPGD